MPKTTGNELVIHYDGVHIITVNYTRQEARLFENGGSKEGTLVFKSDEPAAKASITDAMQLVDMGLRFGVSYDLLSRVAAENVLKTFELLGVKAFLDKVVALTTDTERHQRFEGFEFSFAKVPGNGTAPQPTEAPAEPQPAPTDETEETTTRKKSGK